MVEMELKVVSISVPKESQLIVGTSHFIKTVEDVAEVLKTSVPNVKFGVGFCEASGKCLVRTEGNDADLRKEAAKSALELGAGHSFVVFLQGAFPINVLNALKMIPEVCSIHCATANPVQVILAETEQGRGILGVVDGHFSKGIENEKDVIERRRFLRDLGYKLS